DKLVTGVQTCALPIFLSPREAFHANVIGTLNALEICRRYSAKMIFASAYVYGESQGLPIREDHPLAATNPYTESKILGERLCFRSEERRVGKEWRCWV